MNDQILAQIPSVKEKRETAEDPPVIFKGAQSWIATYSDMMSLLLTFFILLFSVSEMENNKVYEVMQGFEEYFKVHSKKLGYYPRKISTNDIPGFSENSVNPLPLKGHRGKTRAIREFLEQIDRFASVVKEDNREIIVIPGMILFHRGKAKIRQEAIPTLLRAADRLVRTSQEIKVVGHTSSEPLDPGADAKDHYSLGFLRALAVGRFLSGEERNLSLLAKEIGEKVPNIPAHVESVSMDRLLISSQAWNVPNPARKNLWENTEMDDRVEIIFYSNEQEK